MSECLSHACSPLIILISYLDLYSYCGWPKVYGYFSYSSVLLPSELFKALNITRTKKKPHLVCLCSFRATTDVLLSVCVFNNFFYDVLPYSTVMSPFMSSGLLCCKTVSKLMLKSKKVYLFSVYATCFSILEENYIDLIWCSQMPFGGFTAFSFFLGP